MKYMLGTEKPIDEEQLAQVISEIFGGEIVVIKMDEVN